jgi:hypothetical protein
LVPPYADSPHSACVMTDTVQEWLGIKEARLPGIRPVVRRLAFRLKVSRPVALRLASCLCPPAFRQECKGCRRLGFFCPAAVAFRLRGSRPGAHRTGFRRRLWAAVRRRAVICSSEACRFCVSLSFFAHRAKKMAVVSSPPPPAHVLFAGQSNLPAWMTSGPPPGMPPAGAPPGMPPMLYNAVQYI